MSATINRYYNEYRIDQYINNEIPHGEVQSPYYYGGEIPNGTPIINIIMRNGIQPRKSNRVLMSLYPNLFKGCINHLKSSKTPSILYIHKEEGKPDVWNLFVLNTDGNYESGVMRRAKNALRKKEIRKLAFVTNTRVGIDNKDIISLSYYFRGNMTFYGFRKPEIIGETEIPF